MSRRSAVFLPMPGTRVRLAASSACTQWAKASASIVESTASASFGPTPLTRMRSRKRSLSASPAKPKSRCASSRTTWCVKRVTGWPAGGSS